jgi:uncharacterized protein (DUF58 family)
MAIPASESLAASSSPPPRFDLAALARSLAAGVQHGRHRSLARGGSAEFYDYRAYSPGDPTRLIDWRLFGRTDRAYLRRFQQESRLSLVLVVDASPSMDFAALEPWASPGRDPAPRTKKRLACELAAALAHLAVAGGDDVGLIIAGGSPRTLAPSGGWPALHALIHALEENLDTPRIAPPPTRSAAGSTAPAFAGALAAAEPLTPRGGIVLALTDALDEPAPLFDALSRLRFAGGGAFSASRGARRDLALVQILAEDELSLPRAGPARLRDPESPLSVDADLDAIRDEYDRAIRAHIARIREGVIGAGGRHTLAPLARPPIDTLRELLDP